MEISWKFPLCHLRDDNFGQCIFREQNQFGPSELILVDIMFHSFDKIFWNDFIINIK